MNVAVLASPDDVASLVPILDVLRQVGAPAYGLKIRDSWESLPRGEIFRRVDKASHFLVLCSRGSAAKSWFSFAAGFGVGRGSRTALFRLEPSWDPPPYLATLPILDDLEELASYFRLERAEWLVQETRRNARSALLEMGISFHADSLAQCVRDGDLKAVELFLRAGHHPDARDRHGVPLLCLAARGRHLSVANLLVEAGASLDLQSEDRGYSALMDAVHSGAAEIVELLLSRGAALDLRSKDGQTALVVAVGKGDARMAKRLLDFGADPDAADKLGLSARRYAALFKDPAMLAAFEGK
ncbi:MAG TPA: ankyrin repeat domain-containing protein [Spirochaetales bacterium]|nr:ankyrin repeat domain-containing protein [Spirochaetales bacterium]